MVTNINIITKVDYSVKIHLFGCKCKYYRSKIKDNKRILVSPYKKEDFNKLYFIYDSYKSLFDDLNIFSDHCLCTYHDGIYNGGVVIISENKDTLQIENSDELMGVSYKKFDDIKDKNDNSHLINHFCEYFPSLKNYYTVIGITNGTENFTFPKGKISITDNSIDECCYREFYEETKCVLTDEIIKNQRNKRKEMNLEYIPLDVIIDNFLLKIICV